MAPLRRRFDPRATGRHSASTKPVRSCAAGHGTANSTRQQAANTMLVDMEAQPSPRTGLADVQAQMLLGVPKHELEGTGATLTAAACRHHVNAALEYRPPRWLQCFPGPSGWPGKPTGRWKSTVPRRGSGLRGASMPAQRGRAWRCVQVPGPGGVHRCASGTVTETKPWGGRTP